MHWIPRCEWCCKPIYAEDDVKFYPDDLPDHIIPPDKTDEITYHKWCWDEVIADAELEMDRRKDVKRSST